MGEIVVVFVLPATPQQQANHFVAIPFRMRFIVILLGLLIALLVDGRGDANVRTIRVTIRAIDDKGELIPKVRYSIWSGQQFQSSQRKIDPETEVAASDKGVALSTLKVSDDLKVVEVMMTFVGLDDAQRRSMRGSPLVIRFSVEANRDDYEVEFKAPQEVVRIEARIDCGANRPIAVKQSPWRFGDPGLLQVKDPSSVAPRSICIEGGVKSADGVVPVCVTSVEGNWIYRVAIPHGATKFDAGVLQCAARKDDGAWIRLNFGETALSLEVRPLSQSVWLISEAGDFARGFVIMSTGKESSEALSIPSGKYYPVPCTTDQLFSAAEIVASPVKRAELIAAGCPEITIASADASGGKGTRLEPRLVQVDFAAVWNAWTRFITPL